MLMSEWMIESEGIVSSGRVDATARKMWICFGAACEGHLSSGLGDDKV